LWVEGLEGDWDTWTYKELARQLKETFEMEQSIFAERLSNLKMKDGDLATFNTEFAKLAIGARPILGKYRINDIYAGAVKPSNLSAWLQPWRNLPLP
jgi:hypothetical protein